MSLIVGRPGSWPGAGPHRPRVQCRGRGRPARRPWRAPGTRPVISPWRAAGL